MLFTLNWLKSLLVTEADVAEIRITLEQIGFEVEGVVDNRVLYNPFVIASIEEVSPHPDATKLQVCKVYDGKQYLQVVCGAANARAGLQVVLAPVGTKMPKGDLVIKTAKIRGIESQGMLCSAEELGLTQGSEGIIELPKEALVGHNFAEYWGLNDVVFDLAITPNRGDCLSVYGIARELAAAGIGTLLPKDEIKVPTDGISPAIHIDAPDACSEFYLRAIRGVHNGATPTDVAKKLAAIGSSDKGALVSISNYAMLSYGRPNHVYDADKVIGELVIRRSNEGEKFVALGGMEYTLPQGLLVVADSSKVLAIAGVMGGELSKVDNNTCNILVEVANFLPDEVAKSGRALNLLSDSRYRFERRIDHELSHWFMEYITGLITAHCGGVAAASQQAKGKATEYTRSIYLDRKRICSIIGAHISDQQIDDTLRALCFQVEQDMATVPSWRQGDISNIEDLAEEVLRIYGYHTIAGQPLENDSTHLPKQINKLELKHEVAAKLGLHEVITWSFMHSLDLKHYGLNADITLNNPISSEMDVMRPSIVPNIVSLVARNLARGQSNFGVFEYGHIYGSQYEGLQHACLAGARVGGVDRHSVHKGGRSYDFFDVKADILAIAQILGLNPDALRIASQSPEYYHPGQSATFYLGNTVVAYAGALHPKLMAHYDIDEALVCFEVYTSRLPNTPKRSAFGAELSNLQSVSRDFAVVIDQKVTVAELIKAVRSIRNEMLTEVEVFDIYQGPGIPQGYKSVALSVHLQPWDKTMTDQQIEVVSEQIVSALAKIGGTLR